MSGKDYIDDLNNMNHHSPVEAEVEAEMLLPQKTTHASMEAVEVVERSNNPPVAQEVPPP